MEIMQLLKRVETYKIIGDEKAIVEGLSFTDTGICKNYVYFCIKGTKVDGLDYVENAVKNGASVVVSEQEIETTATLVLVQNVRMAMSLIASEFYGNPAEKLRLIGVTGTNGKTTTCHLVRNILRFSGYKVGVIGTLGVFYGSVEIAPELTTPDSIFLHKIFADMVKAGMDFVVMEVSAHAMDLDKLFGVRFEVGVFTNFTQDHLDYFKTMERYADAKAKFLTPEYCDFMVFNTDDEVGRKLFLSSGIKCASYGIEAPSDVFAINIKEGLCGTNFVLNLFDNIYNVKCKMAGIFTVYNCLAAATCCAVINVDFDDIIYGLNTTEGVNGRIELIRNESGKMIFVDYAHTPDGLRNVLLALKRCTPGRLLCLFGCGGNRDRTKRCVMGEVAGSIADYVIITSDNPRFEEPCDIIGEIEKGVRGKTLNYITIQDRKSAIEYGIKAMREQDVLLIAGKGAEEYQEILGVRHEYNDKRYVQFLLGERESF